MTGDSFALNDTYILNLQKMEWCEIKLFSTIPDFKVFCRCGHSSIIYSNYHYFITLFQ
jgi:hypothetical protein